MKTWIYGLPLLSLLVSNLAMAEFYQDADALKRLFSGNSLVGTYNELQFIQTLHQDGSVHVAVKGDKTILKAKWFINDKAEYCEQWPDHTSCFLIGIDTTTPPQGQGGQLLKVKGKDSANIVSYLHQGILPLEFSSDK